MKILLVEDEKDLRDSIAEGLRLSGYVVDTAADGIEGEEAAFVEDYDLLILDINLPGMDGFELLESLRARDKSLNIILLTARGDVQDRVRGLDLGANDYMVKPFYFEELEARIRSLLRRKTLQEDRILSCQGLHFDTVSRRATVAGEEMKLTNKEVGILEYLLYQQGRYVPQSELLDHVWEGDVDVFSDTVRVHMASLRKKIKEKLGKNIIHNVVGKGYGIYEETPSQKP